MIDRDIPNLKEDPDFLAQEHYTLEEFRSIIAFLASPNGCPWDHVQTAKTLQKHLLEEAYEAYDAIESGDETGLREELGDLLLQIVFQANLAESFTLQEVIDGIAHKMISRHTHVFGSDRVENTTEVLDVWEANKRREKEQLSHTDALNGVARALPALTRATKLQAKAAKAGFDWPTIEGPEAKVREELAEANAARLAYSDVLEATKAEETGESNESDVEQRFAELELEVGDLLFAVVNWARHAGVDPEIALDRANHKFLTRFSRVEAAVRADRQQMHKLDLDALDAYWDRVKQDQQTEADRS